MWEPTVHVVAAAVPVTSLLLAITGVAWVARGVIGLASPTYYAPVSALDFAAVWAFSGALLLTAASFAALVRTWPERDRAVGVAALAGSAAAVAASIGNALEDALDIDAGWMLYVAGAIGTALAFLVLGGLAFRAGRAGRLAGGALIAAAIGLFAADAGGLVVTGLAFFALAWERVRRDR